MFLSSDLPVKQSVNKCRGQSGKRKGGDSKMATDNKPLPRKQKKVQESDNFCDIEYLSK